MVDSIPEFLDDGMICRVYLVFQSRTGKIFAIDVWNYCAFLSSQDEVTVLMSEVPESEVHWIDC